MVASVKHVLEFNLSQIVVSVKHVGFSQGLTLEECREALLNILPNSTYFKKIQM